MKLASEQSELQSRARHTTVQRVYLIRHGETPWTLTGQHTGLTDIPLTDHGRETARRLEPVLTKLRFDLVLTSPLQRARETCELAGLGERAHIDRDLVEWNYGDYEGLTTKQILAIAPGWSVFTDGCPGGERPEDVGARVDRLIARARSLQGHVALFAHGHLFKVLAARWLGLPVAAGSHFILDTATLNILSSYQGVPALKRWNARLKS
jgi:broad specificity phosphatase PhoE